MKERIMKRLYLLLVIVSIHLSCKMNPDTELTQFPLISQGIPFTEIPEEEEEVDPVNLDIEPPVLMSGSYNSSGQYCLVFDENLANVQESGESHSSNELWNLNVEDNQITLIWVETPEPVTEYSLSLKSLSGRQILIRRPCC